MKWNVILLASLLISVSTLAGTIEKVYHFNQYQLSSKHGYQTVSFEDTKQAGLPGEPSLPYRSVVLMLPPGEGVTDIEIIRENEIKIPGTFELFPRQYDLPLSQPNKGSFVKKEQVYKASAIYPLNPGGSLDNQFLNGYSLALSVFTPVVYHPASGTLSYFSKVTIRISTAPSTKAVKALDLLTASASALSRVRTVVQNPEMIDQYPLKVAGSDDYKLLVITPEQFVSEYSDLLNFYTSNGVTNEVQTTEYIDANMAGNDLQQKVRNYIRQEYTNNNIEFALLGGDIQFVPYRGLYCIAYSGSDIYEDYNIPGDIYFSALDGEWNDSTLAGGSVSKWGELGEEDLYPDVAVARLTFNNVNELQHMIHKSYYYQQYPVLGESNRPYLVGEYLYNDPPTYGGDYMELLVDDHDDNGYFTHGIPAADNDIVRLYDTPTNNWDPTTLVSGINQGKSFIHHLGHSTVNYMMRLYTSDITNSRFSQVNGVIHNYALIYTQGCIDGAFDLPDCIAEKAISIDNFAVAGVFNSRYGWFNQGTTDGPSQHLQREFVSAMYNDTVINQIKEIGAAHMMSKIKTAPWVGLPGEF
ncbi:MAG: C25 family cysteine peptidase, partial [bacterium]